MSIADTLPEFHKPKKETVIRLNSLGNISRIMGYHPNTENEGEMRSPFLLRASAVSQRHLGNINSFHIFFSKVEQASDFFIINFIYLKSYRFIVFKFLLVIAGKKALLQ